MKIAFLEIKPWEQEYLCGKLPDAELLFSADRIAAEVPPGMQDVEALSPFIYSRLSAEIVPQMPRLKLIATRSTGFDHIDLAACASRGVSVANVPFYGENTVAEHTFALILSLSRNVHKSYRHAVEGRMDLASLTGFDLKDKVLGVVGAGRIGLHVIKIARGFGMHVLVFDVQQDGFLAELLGFTYVSMDRILAESDIITLHAPHGPATHHMLNRETLARVKRGALLINTARGGLVDTDALIEALENGTLGGAALDVLEGEELITEESELIHAPQATDALQALVRRSVLVKMDNVVLTPHNAFNSREALERILDTTVENILSFFDGRPVNLVALAG